MNKVSYLIIILFSLISTSDIFANTGEGMQAPNKVYREITAYYRTTQTELAEIKIRVRVMEVYNTTQVEIVSYEEEGAWKSLFRPEKAKSMKGQMVSGIIFNYYATVAYKTIFFNL